MDNPAIEIPKTAVLMVSTFRDYRLSSLSGYCMTFKQGEPAKVPPQAYLEALEAGVTMVKDQPEPEAPKVKEVDPSIAEAAKLEAEAKAAALTKALTWRLNSHDRLRRKCSTHTRRCRKISTWQRTN